MGGAPMTSILMRRAVLNALLLVDIPTAIKGIMDYAEADPWYLIAVATQFANFNPVVRTYFSNYMNTICEKLLDMTGIGDV